MRNKRVKVLRDEKGVRHPGRKHGGLKPWGRVRVEQPHSEFDHKAERRSAKHLSVTERLMRQIRG